MYKGQWDPTILVYAFIFPLLLVLNTARLSAQAEIDSLAEELAAHIAPSLSAGEGSEYDLSGITERLSWHLRNPLDLNEASAEELESLFILNDLQISALLDHIARTGPLADVLELQSVRNFDVALVRQLLPFVTVGTGGTVRSFLPGDLLENPSQELLLYYSRVLDGQEARPGSASSHPGGPQRLNLRYRFHQGEHFRLHLLAEKDPGEAFAGQGKGFDFYSGNLLIEPGNGRLKKLVIGDYLLQFGQGLNLWNGFSLGKGPAALNIARQSQRVKPHSSSGEGFFFRGLAGTIAAGKMLFTPFFSARKLDASIAGDSESSGVSAIRRSGLHRTPGELAARKTLGEQLLGLNAEYRFSKQFSIGFTGHRISFDKPLLPGDDLYERYRFSGSRATAFSLDYRFGRSSYFLFGEIARNSFPAMGGSINGSGWAFIKGILFSPARGLVLAASWRNYGRSFNPVYAAPFGESSNPAGEKGWYLGLESRFGSNWTLTAYADSFSWSWLRYRIDAPSSGYELLVQLRFRPVKELNIYGRYRKTSKPLGRETAENPLREIFSATLQTARIDLSYQPDRRLRLRSRIDYSGFAVPWQGTASGFSVFQGVRWTPGVFRFDFRLTYFNTDNYDTRIYAYESSLLSGASLAFFYDQGVKTYLGVRWKPGETIDIGLRGGLIHYLDREYIGPGPDIRMQLRLRF